jgi:hypothetical protein
MRQPRILCLTIAFIVLAASGYAQTGTWQVVETIPAGTPISVLAQKRHQHSHRFRCDFIWATDDEIACQPGGINRILRGAMVFEHQDVLDVHLEHPSASTLAGAAIGVGLGVGLGATGTNGAVTRTGAALGLGGIFGLVGGVIGRNLPIVRGTVVYRR